MRQLKVGIGYRRQMHAWLASRPKAVQCLEITAEHFFEGDPGPLGEKFPLVVHGLGSEIDAPYVVAAAQAAEARGLSCLRLYLRGADRKGEDFYHAGLTADLHAALASPTLASYDRVFVLGYSLGGHVTLRYAVVH